MRQPPIEIIKSRNALSEFTPEFEVCVCKIEHTPTGKLLILLKHPHARYGGRWGFPGGKKKAGEDKDDTMRREITEETGLTHLRYLTFMHTAYCRIIGAEDYIFHEYYLGIGSDVPPKIQISAEHTAHSWSTPEEILKKENLSPGLHTYLSEG